MKNMVLLVVILVCVVAGPVVATKVSYDHRALVIDGQRRVLISGSIHYPRSTPDMWPELIEKSKEGGLDVIETYVFWDLHEPVRNQYDFEGRKDLVKFVKTIGDAGLLAHLRIGPYACAEWNYGGFPVWLHFIRGIKFRTDNGPFKKEVQRFTEVIVDMMKQENLFAFQGGPIILAQIENEYGNVQSSYGSAAKSYVQWTASMAVAMDIGVPWVMCQQADAPDPVINTCNGFYCDQFTPNSANKPKMWTENWSGWFQSFGGGTPYRPAEDIAFAVARFFQRGGTFQNYYMYHGGTNFGRSAGGPFISTSYDYDAPIDEFGLIRQPKWGHLKELHKAIKLCEEAIVATDPSYISLGSNLEGHVYKASSGACAAFLANIGTQSEATVQFNGNSYQLPPWSVSILPDCKLEAFNTAKINTQTTHLEMKRINLGPASTMGSSEAFESDWSYNLEPIGITKRNSFAKSGLLEQINTTADASDYLWYSTSINIKGKEAFLVNGTQTSLYVKSLGHILHAFVNKNLAGSAYGSSSNAKVILTKDITVKPGKITIDLLSGTVGLQNYGAFFDTWGAGVTGPVQLKSNNAVLDLSSRRWTYQVGLRGEDMGLSSGLLQWTTGVSDLPKNQPLVWYKTSFNAPDGNDPIALDLTGMGKGEAWVNGESIGRYWPAYNAPQNGCVSSCSYKGAYNSGKCLKGCGKPSQSLYHVPRSWIQPGGNTLVLFEEIGGDPTQISFARREAGSLCAHVTESYPLPVDLWDQKVQHKSRRRPVLHLNCASTTRLISSINFASFGTPSGSCGSYNHGHCSSNAALSVVEQACLGRSSCRLEVSSAMFGDDPCVGVTKSLAVEAVCT